MGIADDEDVVGLRSDARAQHAPLGRVEVLGLVHDDVTVARPALGQDPGRLVAQLGVRGRVARGEVRREPFHDTPQPGPLHSPHLGAAPPPYAAQILLGRTQPLRQHDVAELLGEKLLRPREVLACDGTRPGALLRGGRKGLQRTATRLADDPGSD